MIYNSPTVLLLQFFYIFADILLTHKHVTGEGKQIRKRFSKVLLLRIVILKHEKRKKSKYLKLNKLKSQEKETPHINNHSFDRCP